MAPSTKVKPVELSSVSPPPGSVPSTTLPLTFLDIPWLLLPSGQPLFFYDFSISTAEFTQTILPNLKHSLSVTLQYFFPFVAKLVLPPKHGKPRLEYSEGDSISVTVAESEENFSYLSADSPRNIYDLRCLVPNLPPSEQSGEGEKVPLLAVQITVFSGCGICMGFALRPVVADGRTFDNFLKMWASIARKDQSSNSREDGDEDLKLLASHDRSVIHDSNGLESTFLKEWWKIKSSEKEGTLHPTGSNFQDMVRTTFVLGRPEMDKIKKWILTRSERSCGSRQMLLSPYVVTCAFVWVCWVKTHWPISEESEEMHYFGFIAGGITRLKCPVPATYVGNCVAFGRTEATRKELMGENGIAYAAKAIGNTIKKLDGKVLDDAKRWISEWKILFESELHVMITGSPKLKFYSLDFGWGRLKKFEVTIDETRAISLCESREMAGGIEIGLTLPKSRMVRFGDVLNEGLNVLL